MESGSKSTGSAGAGDLAISTHELRRSFNGLAAVAGVGAVSLGLALATLRGRVSQD